MDDSEKKAFEYLRSLGLGDIVYEPDGNVPPDFLVDGRVAIEVRRLNQNVQSDDGIQGLEEVDIPLWLKMRGLLESLGPPTSDVTWFVFYRFKRPVPSWKKLEPELRRFLEGFRDDGPHERTESNLGNGFSISVFRASITHPTLYLLAGCSDQDSGGWLLAEMERNLNICISEKTAKVARVRAKYPEWWLVLVNYIGFGLDDFDRAMFRDQVRVEHDWDRAILVDPTNPERSFEI